MLIGPIIYIHVHPHTSIYIYTSIYIHILPYTSTYIHIYIHPYTSIYIHILPHTSIYIYIYTHPYTSIYIHILPHTSICVYIYTSIYIHIQPYTSTYIHTYIYIYIILYIHPICILYIESERSTNRYGFFTHIHPYPSRSQAERLQHKECKAGSKPWRVGGSGVAWWSLVVRNYEWSHTRGSFSATKKMVCIVKWMYRKWYVYIYILNALSKTWTLW